MENQIDAYQQTVNWLFSQLPMFQRQGKAAYKADLSNTLSLMAVLGHPEKMFKSIHVGGTNGKGSVSHLMASVLQEAGYKVGLYTSPHLKDFRERIKINGKKIPKAQVVSFVEDHKTDFSEMGLSFFEWTVGLAFDYFSKSEVDIALIEVGMGGRLDSTNVITPELSIITNISLDHTQFLGDTLEKIAGEKAGIIKYEIPIVIGKTQDETKAVFEEKATSEKAPISFVNQEALPSYQTDLKGEYQRENLNTVLKAIELIQKSGSFTISPKHLSKGLMSVSQNTGLLGRWQILNHAPLIVADTAHNISGLQAVMNQIHKTPFHALHMVFGTLSDKDLNSILPLLPKKGLYYLCSPNIERALPGEQLSKKMNLYGFQNQVFPSVIEAFEAAKSNANENDMVFVGGSTFVVAEIL